MQGSWVKFLFVTPTHLYWRCSTLYRNWIYFNLSLNVTSFYTMDTRESKGVFYRCNETCSILNAADSKRNEITLPNKQKFRKPQIYFALTFWKTLDFFPSLRLLCWWHCLMPTHRLKNELELLRILHLPNPLPLRTQRKISPASKQKRAASKGSEKSTSQLEKTEKGLQKPLQVGALPQQNSCMQD